MRSSRPLALLLTLLSTTIPLGCTEPTTSTSPPGRPPSGRATWIDDVLDAEDARDAGQPLLAQALANDDIEVRRYAIRALGRIGARESVLPLANAARDASDDELRVEALFAIGLTGSSLIPDAVAPSLQSDSAEARAAALFALGESGDERMIVELLDRIADAAPIVRAHAALAIAKLGTGRDDPTFGRPIRAFDLLEVAMRHDDDAQVRWCATYAASKLKRAEFRASFLAALKDDDARVRGFAADGLAALPPDAPTRDALTERLNDVDWVVAVEAAKALAADPSPPALVALARTLPTADRAGHPSFQVRAAAAESLGRFKDVDGVVAVLTTALADPYESVRDAAIESLAATSPPTDAVRVLEDARAGKTAAPATPYLLARVARAAAALGEDGWPTLRALLDDARVPVKSAALAESKAFRSHLEELRPAFEAALAADDVALRESAAGAIEAIGDAALAPAVEKSLRASKGPEFIEARLSLLKALAKLDAAEAATKLREWLRDDERVVRQAASDLIASAGGSLPRLPPMPPLPRAARPRAGVDFLSGKEDPRATLITRKGNFVIRLFPDAAPTHVAAFVARARAGFYDGLTIHRLVPGFVVQGLDPRGDGYGTGDASLRSEVNQEMYERGTVGMPDAGKDTGGCQIFVTFRPQPRLDARYTAFGKVVEGMEIVERLDLGDVIERVEIH